MQKALSVGLLVLLSQLCLTGSSSMASAKVPIVKIGSKNVVKLEVASTQTEIEHGLMYRTSMPEDSGMVFLFHPPRPVNFWMYHTLISLDMLFVKDGKIVKLFEHVPPCKSQNPHDCPTYPGNDATIEVSAVIELNGGYAERHGVKEGDSIDFQLPK